MVDETFPAKVLYDFQGESAGELDCAAGETVTVLEDEDPWSLVKNKRGQEGYVPSNYLEQIEEEIVKIVKPPPRKANPPPPAKKAVGGGIASRMAAFGNTQGAVKSSAPPPSVKTNNPAPKSWSKPWKTSGSPPTPSEPIPPSPARPKRKRANTANMDNSVAYNLFASSTEWWCCLALFFSGVFSILWGSQESPEDKLAEFLGCMQAITAGLLLPYFALYRDYVCCGQGGERAALLRAFILFLCSFFCWPAYPTGYIGGGACLIACFANILVYVFKGKKLEDEGVEVEWLTMNIKLSEVFSSKITAALFSIVIIGLNVAFFYLGMHIGNDKFDKEFDNGFKIGEWYYIAEGFGVMISMDMVCLLLTSMSGFHSWFWEWARTHEDDDGCITKPLVKFIQFFFDGKRQIFLHRSFASLIALAAIGHCVYSFYAYQDSGPARDYILVFGQETFITGVLLILFLIPVFSSANPKIRKTNMNVFLAGHGCWLVVLILLFIHGKADPIPWNSNFWKFAIAPCCLFLLDKFYSAGVSDTRDFFEGKAEA